MRGTTVYFTLCALALLAAGVAAADRDPQGVVVVGALDGGGAARAGLEEGDVLLEWRRSPSPPANPEPGGGALRSPFDLLRVEDEEVPRGGVTVVAARGDERFTSELAPVPLRVEYAFCLPRAHAGQSRVEVAQALARRGDASGAAWLLFGEGRAAEGSREGVVEAPLREGSRLAEDPVARAQLLEVLGGGLEDRRRWSEAGAIHLEEARWRLALDPAPLGLAKSAANLGMVAWRRGTIRQARGCYLRAVAIERRAAPDGFELSACLTNLGSVVARLGELAAAEWCHTRALAIRRELVPGSLEETTTLNNLGFALWGRGDLVAAEERFREALAGRERIDPDSLKVAMALNNLAVVVARRGDLASAEDFHRRALAIRERLDPDGPEVAASLNNLATLKTRRGELDEAAKLQLRALAIKERLEPGTLSLAVTLNNLGYLAGLRGDVETAEAYLRRALAIKERLAPGSLDVASGLLNLGSVARDRNDLPAAESLYRDALAIRERLAPGSLDMFESLSALGRVALDRTRFGEAEEYLRRALAIVQAWAPGSVEEAETLHALGQCCRDTGRPDPALELFARAVDALESQQGRLGGSEEARAAFRESYLDYYREYIDLLLAQGRPDDAFHVYERSRARGLLAMLAERDLVFGADLPPGLERRRRLIAAEYDRTQAELGEASLRNDVQRLEELRSQLHRLRSQQDEIREEIRRCSPRLAALQYPDPLRLEQARSVLDAGSALLAFDVGPGSSRVFVLSATGELRVVPLALGEAELEREVEALRGLISREHLGAAGSTAWAMRAEDLDRSLLGPVRPLIEGCQRLLVIPDGPLHLLPLAALVEPGGEGRPASFLVESRSLHLSPSLTVLAELRAGRVGLADRPAARQLVAFGDVSYGDPLAPSSDGQGSAALRSLLARGHSLGPLPASRDEVLAIASLFGDEAEVFLGAAASEEQVKEVGRGAGVLHFAVHAFVDTDLPLDSGVVLAAPSDAAASGENGLLQAWEIFEQVRLDADLVTLSACETALGREWGGEGIVGVTRAFQYAGARSVLASLWQVGDVSTGVLMRLFYQHLHAGDAKDEALRQAQVELLRSASAAASDGRTGGLDLSHPFHWSAFQLYGDWR